MFKKVIGLLTGPLIVIVVGSVGIADFGELWPVIALYIGMAAVVFVPFFAALTAIFGSSLLVVLLVSNAIPFCFLMYNCTDGACRGLAGAIPFFGAANFCGFIYWIVASRRL